MKFEDISTLQIEKLTEKFYRKSSFKESSGVGLHLVKNLVEQIDGIMTFHCGEDNLFKVILILGEVVSE